MKSKNYFIIILLLSIAGMIFSGYLSYYNVFEAGCEDALISCGTKPVEIFGLPNCVYGFAMFVVVGILSVIGLDEARAKKMIKTILILSIIGVLFAGSLSYYEMYVIGSGFSSIPACVYGFFLYILILIFSIFGHKAKHVNI
ncbi:vitamin K epoxide reductase family protein [Patescibacteria group bacterium]|nr:vitamin K epoxide reductase family protein [Patescibacteria group bacterium]MBU0963946.1 vitamin K epoxide reductase family protein [Patescibacteria group bacterium]